MTKRDLEAITEELRAKGLAEDAAVLREALTELRDLERPPGILRRMTTSVKETATRHMRLALEELRESREAFDLLHSRVRHGRKLSDAEADALRAQVIDAVKSVPAGLLAAATSVVPVPGAMLLAPWMLERVGLLPSRWREDTILAKLRAESEHLRQEGEDSAAADLDAFIVDAEARMAERRQLADRTALLTHWDVDGDGQIDEKERAAYEREVDRLAALVPRAGARRRWYVQLGGQVFGPARWGELLEAEPSLPLSVCLDGRSGWVDLDELIDRAGFGPQAG